VPWGEGLGQGGFGRLGGKKDNLATRGNQSLGHKAAIVPKTLPNPLKNGKEVLKQFP
jgi:hypothetical protein